MNNSAVIINEVPMLQKLDKLIDLRDNAFVDLPEQPADSINEAWISDETGALVSEILVFSGISFEVREVNEELVKNEPPSVN